MLKLIKNQVNLVELVVSSTIDIDGFSAKLTINSKEVAISDISVRNPTFTIQPSDVASLGECNALLPLEIIDTKGSVYSTVKVAARAVDTAVGVIRNDQRIFTVLVGEIASPSEGHAALEAEIEARKAADVKVLDDAKDYTDKKFSEAKIFVYAGQINSFADLPTDATIGSVYNVVDTGANYVWNGEVWDKLSENIDLSIFPTKTDLANEEKARKEADEGLQSSIDGLTTTIGNLTDSVNTIKGELAKKATTDALNAVDEAVKSKASAESVTELTSVVDTKVAQSDFDTLKADVEKKALKSDLDALSATVDGKADNSALTAIETEVGKKASQTDMTALQGTVTTLSEDVAKKADATALTNLESVVDGKADSSALKTLEGTVATKADQSSLDTLTTEVGNKASQSDLTALSSTVDTKADASAVTALESAVGEKASQSELDDLKTTVESKAASSDLTSLQSKVNGILDGETLISSLVFTLEGDTSKKYRIKVELVDDGSGTGEPTLSVVPA